MATNGTYAKRGVFFVTPMVVLLAVVYVSLLIARGGYEDWSVEIIATLAAAALLILRLLDRAEIHLTVPTICLFLVGCFSLISALANGISLTMLTMACGWFALTAVALVIGACDAESVGSRLAELLCMLGVLTAMAGAIACSGLFDAEPLVRNDRLEIVFQYANASGIWLAAISALCICSNSKQLNSVAFMPIVALLLTRSVGSILVFCVGVIALALAFYVRKAPEMLCILATQLWLGLALFGLQLLFAPLALIAPVACVAVFVAVTRDDSLPDKLPFQQRSAISIVAIALFFVVLFAVAVLVFPDRIQSASQTLLKRYVQIADALNVLGGNLLFGIGPDSWRELHPFVQSAQYAVAVVHCSYLQLALDAGIGGLLAFVVMVVAGFVRLVKRRQTALIVIVSMMLLHALLDLDVRFGALIATLVFLMFCAESWGLAQDAPAQSSSAFELNKPLSAVVCCVIAAACVAGVVCEMQRSEVRNAGLDGDMSKVEQAVQSPLFWNDVTVRTMLCGDWMLQANAKSASEYCEAGNVQTAEQAFMLHTCFVRAGRGDDAFNVIATELEREPYNRTLFKRAKELFEEQELSSEQLESYRALVKRANELSKQGNAALLADNKPMPAL